MKEFKMQRDALKGAAHAPLIGKWNVGMYIHSHSEWSEKAKKTKERRLMRVDYGRFSYLYEYKCENFIPVAYATIRTVRGDHFAKAD